MMAFLFAFCHQTPLHVAARMGNKQIVELLIKRGAKIKKYDNNDEIPLFVAIRGASVDVVDVLLQGFKMSTTNRKRQTALHLACLTGSSEIAGKLVDASDVNARDVFGNTPLHYATMGNCGDIVNTLLVHRADATIRNAKGKSPFFYASVEIAKQFRQHFQADGALDNLASAMQKQHNKPKLLTPPRPKRHFTTSSTGDEQPSAPPAKPALQQNEQQVQHLSREGFDNSCTSSEMMEQHQKEAYDSRERNSTTASRGSSKQQQTPSQRSSMQQQTPSQRSSMQQQTPSQQETIQKQSTYVTREELENFKAEMKQEINDLTQKMKEMMIQLKRDIMESQGGPSISPKA